MSFTTWTDEQLIVAAKSSSSILETMRKIGIGSGSYRRIKGHLERLGFNIKELFPKSKSIEHSKYTNETIFCENSKLARNCVREHIIKKNLIEYKCAECGITNSYNGKYIVLQLDHINGKADDNRLENLRWLCPNCHSQTDTFAGRNLPKKGRTPYKKKGFAKERPGRRKVDFEKIRARYSEIQSYSLVGREFGISDTSVRRIVSLSGAMKSFSINSDHSDLGSSS